MTDEPERLGEPQEGEAPPAVIQLPDQSQSEPPPQRPEPRRRSGKMKGRHFGPRPVANPRNERIDLRVTPAQRAAIKAAAQAAGFPSVSAFICAQCLGDTGPRARRASGPDTEWFVKMLAALGRSGNNLNQLLRHINSYDFRGHPELVEMHAAMKAAHAAHRQLCEAIMAELGV